MPWVSYKAWSHAVTGKRIRVPPTGSSIAALGTSSFAFVLVPGTLGKIQNILEENAAAPRYVTFSGFKLDLTYAAEVRIERRENTERAWASATNAHASPDDTIVLIRRGELDRMEIEV